MGDIEDLTMGRHERYYNIYSFAYLVMGVIVIVTATIAPYLPMSPDSRVHLVRALALGCVYALLGVLYHKGRDKGISAATLIALLVGLVLPILLFILFAP